MDPSPSPDAPEAQALLGRWRLLRAHHTLDFAPEAGMEFRADGELIYSFAVGERRQEIALVYQLRGNELRTLSPTGGHETHVHYRIGAGDVLVFDFGGPEACFVRES